MTTWQEEHEARLKAEARAESEARQRLDAEVGFRKARGLMLDRITKLEDDVVELSRMLSKALLAAEKGAKT